MKIPLFDFVAAAKTPPEIISLPEIEFGLQSIVLIMSRGTNC